MPQTTQFSEPADLSQDTERPDSEDVTYSDYVRGIPEFNWLYQCLKHEPGAFSVWCSNFKNYPTRVTIADSTNDTLIFSSIVDADKLHDALANRKPDISTRVIILTYEHPWSFDRKFVETIGSRFRINHRFFYGNLVYGDETQIIAPWALKRKQTTQWRDALPSQTISFELRQSRPHCQNGNVFSAMILNPTNSNCPEDKKTVLVLIRDGLEPGPEKDPGYHEIRTELCRWPDGPMFDVTEYQSIYSRVLLSENTLSARYLACLRTMDIESIRSADKNVIEYAIPYGHILATEFDNELQSWLDQYDDKRKNSIDQSTKINGADVDNMVLLLQHWQSKVAFAKRNVSLLKPSPVINKLTEDCNDLIERSEALVAMLRDTVTQHVGFLSVKASNESIIESRRVNKLTYAAFVFIPISLISSIFGMNVSELGSGSVRIYLFFAISGPLLFISLVSIWWAPRTSRWKEQFKDKLTRMISQTISRAINFIFYTVLLSPVEAYTAIGLGILSHTRDRGRSRQWPEGKIADIESRIEKLRDINYKARTTVGRWSSAIKRRRRRRRRRCRSGLSTPPASRAHSGNSIPSLPQRRRNNMQFYLGR